MANVKIKGVAGGEKTAPVGTDAVELEEAAGGSVWASVTNLSKGIDHTLTVNYVANEHIDWTADQGATNINNLNITGLLHGTEVDNPSSGVHGVTGNVVGTTDSQTLTNKTLTTPTITLSQGTNPTPTQEGEIQWDTDGDQIKVGDGIGTKTFSDDSQLAAAGHTHTLTDVTDSGALAALNTVGTTEIDNNAADNTKISDMAQDTIKGRITASTGDPEDLTAAQVRTIINVENGATADQTAGEIEAIVNHDNLVGFVGNEHLDWTSDQGATDIHANNVPDGADATAIHDNVSGEISVITEKASPVSADLLIIEDSAAANAKKRVQIGNLPGGGGGTNVQVDTGGNLASADFQDGGDINFAEAAGVVTATIKTDVVGTAELDDGADTPLSGEYVRVDTVDQAGFEYRTTAEVLSDIGAAASSHTHTLADITDDGALAALNTVGTTEIDNNAVTYAKIQDVTATDRLLGRSTAGAGDVEEIVCTATARTLLDDATTAAMRTTLDVDQAGTDNSTNVTLAGTPDYITITGQEITRNQIDLTTDVTGDLPVAEGGTGASTAATARANLGVDYHSKSITVEDPTATEDISIFFTNEALTISEMRAVVRGSTPSVTWTIRHGTDRSATGAEVVTGGTTTTSATTGSDVVSFNDATIVADSFIWLETTAQTGTVDELHITIIYDEDA